MFYVYQAWFWLGYGFAFFGCRSRLHHCSASLKSHLNWEMGSDSEYLEFQQIASSSCLLVAISEHNTHFDSLMGFFS
jgi:hypothetical protein